MDNKFHLKLYISFISSIFFLTADYLDSESFSNTDGCWTKNMVFCAFVTILVNKSKSFQGNNYEESDYEIIMNRYDDKIHLCLYLSFIFYEVSFIN